MKYSVVTFGCRVNQADSLGFEEGLRAGGHVAAEPDQADVVVVNTCSVTSSADQSARQIVRRISRQNPSARIIVTGCYATRRPDEVAALPQVTRVVLNNDKAQLVPLLFHAVTTADRFGAGEGSCGAPIEPGVAGRTAFTLRVQTGCAQPCAYCIIPATRGRPASVTIAAVLREVERVVAAGFKEIALTGVHLGSYGRDLTPAASLVELLRALAGIGRAPADRSVRLQPDVLFRISSLEPMDCAPKIVELVATSKAFAPHFHLPLQHASDRMLRAMRRPYTIGQYGALVDSIRARMPGASIGSDVIVGFPGETDDDFAELAAYLDGSPLTHVHVFPYSDRPGTEASALAGKVAGTVVRERARLVRDIAQRLSARFRNGQVGTVHRGLTLEDGTLVVTGNYLKVRIAPGRGRNEWVDLRLTDVTDTIRGEILTPSA
jgi:threonylcarbamoyladenosine tRNA methylthiotransferase MtaB